MKKRLANIRKKINELSNDLNDVWPPGWNAGAKPATRFDLPRQYYFNSTHMYFPDDFTNVKKHSKIDSQDIEVSVFFVCYVGIKFFFDSMF